MTRVLADERMSDVDAVVWAVERLPRNRTTIAALVRFARPLDPADLRHRVDRASRVVPRLRQRVINDPVAAPRWSVDPEFRLSFHLRSRHLQSGDDQALAALARDLIVQPFDRSRPLWEFTYITGLDDGGAALLLKSHHAVSDGVGGVEMMLELFDLTPEPARERTTLPIAPTAPPAAPRPLFAEAVREEVSGLGRAVRDTLTNATPPSLPSLAEASRRIGEVLGSATRMFSPPPDSTVLPDQRSDHLDVRFFSLALDDLRQAGRRVDGTINDAFVTAVALGIADHTRETTAPLRVSVPLSTRGADDGVGNHWTPGRIDIDLADAHDSELLCAAVQRSMRRLRDEPAHQLLAPLAAGLRRLPPLATASIFESLTARVDVAASNVPGSPVPLHLCGEPVTALVPFGPLSGCAVNVTLLSHADTAHIGISSDPAAIADADALARAIEGGISAVVKGS